MFTAIAVGLRERRFLRKERSGSPHRSSRIRGVPRTHLPAYSPILVYKCSQCTAGTGVRRKTGLHNSRTRDRCTDIRIFERLLGSWPRLLHKDGQSTCTHLKANSVSIFRNVWRGPPTQFPLVSPKRHAIYTLLTKQEVSMAGYCQFIWRRRSRGQ